MDYNLHTHTTRCHHAEDECEKYVLKAIESGYKTLGFSEHIPLILPNGSESLYRMCDSEAQSYADEINALKEKYKDVIDIKLGFETEYYPEYFDSMLVTSSCKTRNISRIKLLDNFTFPGEPRRLLFVNP